jgi:integrase
VTTIGFSLFRRRRDGVLSKRWTIQIRMPDGTLQQRTAFTDKAASQQLGARLVRDIERKEVGLYDVHAIARKTPIGEHVRAFLVSMENGTLGRRRSGGTPKADWIARAGKRLSRMLAGMGAIRIEHLQQVEAEAWLSERVREGWSAKTRDDHASLLRQFGGWLVDERRAAANPFHRLRPTRDAASKTFRRHALTVAELEKLIEASEVRPLQEGVKANPWMTTEHREQLRVGGVERAVLYQVAAYTGLRRGEVLQIAWSDVDLGQKPAITVRPETTKNHRGSRLELPSWLGKLLEQVRDNRAKVAGAVRPGSELVFTASYRHVTERLRLDALFAGIGAVRTVRGKERVVAADGRVIDFHALRGTLATLAAEVGMPTKLLQEHLRHRDVRMTMDVYAQVRSEAMRTEVERLPKPGPAQASAPASPTATGIARIRPAAGGGAT